MNKKALFCIRIRDSELAKRDPLGTRLAERGLVARAARACRRCTRVALQYSPTHTIVWGTPKRFLRHYVKTQDKQNLQDCKEAVYAAMQYLEKMVKVGENFPLTHGTDDTFDNLSSHGISVYCGSLWIAGLRAAAKIAEILGDKAQADTWNAKADAANKEFDEALWDEAEGYYHFFVTPMEAKDVVADKLPQFADAIKDTLVIDGTNVKAALKTINEWLNSGEIPSDVWIGIQYSIMCAMMHHGFAVSHKVPSVKLGRWRE